MKYEQVHAAKGDASVRVACEALGVSTTAYYDWLRRRQAPPTERELDDKRLKHEIRVAFDEGRGTYGRPRIQEALRARDIHVGANRIRRKMREMGLNAKPRRLFKNTTLSEHDERVASNLLARNFTADAPNQVWVSDITYVRTWEGWVYACFVIDLFSRKVVGWALDDHMRADLVTRALDMAISRRSPPAGLILHSDRGSQYVSKAVRRRVRRHHLVQSMSRRGDCFDNAVAESFHDKLKQELIYRGTWPNRQTAISAVVEYVERFYNPRRMHSTLNYMSPNEFELQHAATTEAAA